MTHEATKGVVRITMKRLALIYERENTLKVSQLEVAEMLGISRTFYNQIENGTRNPGLALAMEISKLFGVPVEKLFGKDASRIYPATGTE